MDLNFGGAASAALDETLQPGRRPAGRAAALSCRNSRRVRRCALALWAPFITPNNISCACAVGQVLFLLFFAFGVPFLVPLRPERERFVLAAILILDFGPLAATIS